MSRVLPALIALLLAACATTPAPNPADLKQQVADTERCGACAARR